MIALAFSVNMLVPSWPFLCVCDKSEVPSNNDKGVSIDTIQAWVEWVDWCCFEGYDKASILLLPGTTWFSLSYKYFYLVQNLLCRIQILIQSTLCTCKNKNLIVCVFWCLIFVFKDIKFMHFSSISSRVAK